MVFQAFFYLGICTLKRQVHEVLFKKFWATGSRTIPCGLHPGETKGRRALMQRCQAVEWHVKGEKWVNTLIWERRPGCEQQIYPSCHRRKQQLLSCLCPRCVQQSPTCRAGGFALGQDSAAVLAPHFRAFWQQGIAWICSRNLCLF